MSMTSKRQNLQDIYIDGNLNESFSLFCSSTFKPIEATYKCTLHKGTVIIMLFILGYDVKMKSLACIFKFHVTVLEKFLN